MANDTCPKCGSSRTMTDGAMTWFLCGSDLLIENDAQEFHQTSVCRADHATAQLSAARSTIAELTAALQSWLDYAEDNLSEFDDVPCDGEELCCSLCHDNGLINLKVLNTRAALAKAVTQ